MHETAPLIKRAAHETIAQLTQGLNGFAKPQQLTPVTAAQFLNHVEQLAARLPDGVHAINLCDNRYVFMVALCAVVLRQQTNLLPANKNTATQQRLAERYMHCYVLHDGVADIAEDLNVVDLSAMDWSLPDAPLDFIVPKIPLPHLAVICFTSGSTGDSKPINKSWRTLVHSSEINRRYMLPDALQVYTHLATVPGQHMWGLETSVLLPMFANASLVDAKPLYPQDIVDLLWQLPEPRSLVSTPLHLRALANATNAPALANVLCATAPLHKELAHNIEKTFNTRLREVYGCSEVGSMALRIPIKNEVWEVFAGLHFESGDDDQVTVAADHIADTVRLEDRLDMHDHHHFSLRGRSSDQINIAGKRGSLAEINKVLMAYPHISDGVVFFPEQERSVPRLVALVVLDDAGSKQALQTHFRKYLDTAFVPRPILPITALPREENGKLLKNKLLALYQSL